jgi:hypothetical protein
MRRLITYIARLTLCLTIPIIGVRAIHLAPPPDSCIQLLDPIALSVLTVDASTGTALLDARHRFPLLLASSATNLPIVAITENASTFTLNWDSRTVRFPRQGAHDERLQTSWLTADVLLLAHTAADRRTVGRLDTRSMSLTMLFAFPTSTEYFTDWHDDDHVAVSTRTNLTLYRLSDGAAIFEGMAPSLSTIYFFIAPDEHAALLSRERDSGFGRANLSLITDSARRTVANTDVFTSPAWSSNGTLFTFAESYTEGWLLKVMSRAGNLLRTFNLSTATRTATYQQVRWTNCE